MLLMVQGRSALFEARVPQFPFRVCQRRGQREGRSKELRPFPKSQTGETEERFPNGILGLGEMRTFLVSGSTCGDRTLRRVAKGAREVLSSSAAEAATRMDFLSHLNSTGRRCSPQSGGIPPASDAAVAAAPRARLGETNCLVGGGRKGKHHLRGTD